MGDRDRSPRRERRSGGRPGGRGGGGGGGGPSRKAPPERRIFISNIPFEMKWQEVKDMFRETVGDVTYVELFNDENEKPRGCGILEFGSEELAKKAIEKMHRKEFKGRKLVVKEDFDTERDKFGRIARGSRGERERSEHRDRGRDDSVPMGMGGGGGGGGGGPRGNTYGLSPEFLDSLGIDCPLHTRLFVANLSYSVDEKKLREVFRLAGRLVSAELNRDKEGKSRGHGVVEFTHPVEAVQSISMFNEQMLFDRKMTVRFDKQPGPTPEELDQLPSRLPEGLHSVGMGLGSGGNPLTNVAQNLPSAQNNANSMMGSGNGDGGGGGGGMGNNSSLQAVAALAQQLSMVSNLQNNAGAGLSNNLVANLTAALSNANSNTNMGSNMNNPVGMNAPSGMGGMTNSMGSGMGSAMGSSMSTSLSNPMGGSGSMGMGGMGGNPGHPGPGLSSVSMGMGSANGGMGGGGGGGGSSVGYNTGGVGSGYGSASRNSMGDSSRGMTRAVGVMGGSGAMGGSSGLRGTDSILIRNLPIESTWQFLRERFSHCGEIKYAEMKDRGTGLIRFNSERDAERAVSMMDHQSMNGHTIEVRLF